MRALLFHGARNLSVEDVPEPGAPVDAFSEASPPHAAKARRTSKGRKCVRDMRSRRR